MGRSLDFTELSGGLDLESALIYDAVHLLAVSLRQLRYIDFRKESSLFEKYVKLQRHSDDRG